MIGLRTASVTGGVIAAIAGAVFVAPPALAHHHPTPVELDSPGVVFVQTVARVNISLIEHNRLGRHIALVQRTYSPVLATGSGFAVDPAGAIVTSAAVVQPNLRRAEIFAVNKLFNERYGSEAAVPNDPFTEHTVKDLPDDPVNQRLQRCYQPNTADDTGGCIVAVTREVRVFPYVTSQKLYGTLPAEVLTPKPGAASELAVLRVGASSMPTVNLGQSAAGAQALSILGFIGVPGRAHELIKADAHLAKPGGDQLKRDEFFAPATKLLSQGMAGGPVVAEKGQVIGFFVKPPGNNSPRLVSATAITAALSSVGIAPQRGPVDAVFEDASHSFKNRLYAASIPSLQRTLALYPGHFIAAANLKVARAKAGTAEDLTNQALSSPAPKSGSSGGGLSAWWLIVVIAGGILVLGALIALLVLPRRRRHHPGHPGKPGPEAEPKVQTPAQRPPSGAQPKPPIDLTEQSGRRDPVRGASEPILFVEPTPSGAGRPVPDSASASVASGSMTPARTRGQKSQARSSVLPQTSQPPKPSGRSADTSYCTNCGQPLQPRHRYCGRCGHAADDAGSA